jgi:hypothetical protein
MLASEKEGLGPNIDFFTFEELDALITKFQTERGNLTMTTA